MVLEPLSRNPPPRFIIGDLTVDRVSQFKLLGITVSDKLKWNDHVANICFKLNKHLHFLKQLKRAGIIIIIIIIYESCSAKSTNENDGALHSHKTLS